MLKRRQLKVMSNFFWGSHLLMVKFLPHLLALWAWNTKLIFSLVCFGLPFGLPGSTSRLPSYLTVPWFH